MTTFGPACDVHSRMPRSHRRDRVACSGCKHARYEHSEDEGQCLTYFPHSDQWCDCKGFRP